MTINWENALKSITDHSQALAVVILDGPTRYAWSQPGANLPLDKPEALLRELAPESETYRALRLGSQPNLLYMVSQPDGSRCAFIHPLATRLSTAKADAHAFLDFAQLAPPVSLDSLKALDLHAYKHTPVDDTWQTEFLSLYTDAEQSDHAQTTPSSEDNLDTQPVSLFREPTQPILINPPEDTQVVIVDQTYWVKIV